MTVYTCWSGSYSDRGMNAVFSTKEQAMDYLRIRKATCQPFDDPDDEPIEYDVDSIDVKQPVKVAFSAWRDDYDGQWYCNTTYTHDGEFDVKDRFDYYHVQVNYNESYEVMKKAVIDKVSMLYARDSGI